MMVINSTYSPGGLEMASKMFESGICYYNDEGTLSGRGGGSEHCTLISPARLLQL